MDCSKKPYSACLVGYEYSFFKYCTPTFIRNVFISRFTSDRVVHDDLCSQLGLLQNSLVITPIRQRMIRGRNIHNDDVLANLAQKFSHADKGWLTVFIHWFSLTLLSVPQQACQNISRGWRWLQHPSLDESQVSSEWM